jgi:hypothetical protein
LRRPVRKVYIAIYREVANLFRCALFGFYIVIKATLLEANLISDIFGSGRLISWLRKCARRGR